MKKKIFNYLIGILFLVAIKVIAIYGNRHMREEQKAASTQGAEEHVSEKKETLSVGSISISQ